MRVFIMGRSGCSTKGGNWVRGLPASPKMWTSRSVGYHPHSNIESPPSLSWSQTTYWKKVSLIAFRQILPKMLLVARIFSYTIFIYLKKLDGTKSLNTKQFSAGLSPRIIPQVSPFLPKISPPLMFLCYTHHVWTVPHPWTFMRNPGDGGESYPTTKYFLVSPSRKTSLNRFTSSAIKIVIPSLSNSNFHVITLCKLRL